MASSKVMASSSPANPDLQRHHSYTHSELHTEPSRNFGSMNMDDLLKNIYDEPPEPFPADGRVSGVVGNKTVDEVWKEIVAGSGGGESHREPEMTLEDFLRKAGAVREEDVRLAQPAVIPEYTVDPIGAQFHALPPAPHMQSSQNGPENFGIDSVGFGNSVISSGTGTGAFVRGKRRVVEEPVVDKATQQKQRRMIKNRESAARSRERKQAYTVELEALVTQLEEENARLLREEAELTKQRFKQLMENLIPVVEKRRPPGVLRRLNSI